LQPPGNADAAKPSKDESAPLQVANAKPAPDPSAPPSIGTKIDTDPTPVRPPSMPQLAQTSQPAEVSQVAALPEPLRVLATSLTPANPVQSAASMSLIPATPAAIGVEIAARAKEGSNQFDIRLDPPELGRIDVRLDVGKGGGVNTRLTVDRPETLQLLQNDARGLERALQSAGLKTDDGSLQFSLRQQTADGSGGQQSGPGAPQLAALYVDEDDAAALGAEQYQRAAHLRGGVDIRV
jgi:flagellar hook-length control protein FliK